MKENTKLFLLISIPILITIILLGCMLSVVGGLGGYWYYTTTQGAREQADRNADRESAGKKADKEFANVFDRYLRVQRKLDLVQVELTKLGNEYEEWLAQRDEAATTLDKAEILGVAREIDALIMRQERILEEVGSLTANVEVLILELDKKAQNLSEKDDRWILAMNIAAKARDVNKLLKETMALSKEGMSNERKLNELFINLAEDEILPSQFDTEENTYLGERSRIVYQMSEKRNQHFEKRKAILDLWAKLALLLGQAGHGISLTH